VHLFISPRVPDFESYQPPRFDNCSVLKWSYNKPLNCYQVLSSLADIYEKYIYVDVTSYGLMDINRKFGGM
jgi:hypothetical protein